MGAQIQLIAALKSTDPGDAEQTRLDAYNDGATRWQLRIDASVHGDGFRAPAGTP